MAVSEDTEITLGTGKMLVLFFGLVALCAAFFGLGFKMGKGSAPPIAVSGEPGSLSTASGSARPSAVKPASNPDPSPDLAFFKSTSQKSAETKPAASDTAAVAAAPSTPPADPTAAPAAAGYYVQVAAVS